MFLIKKTYCHSEVRKHGKVERGTDWRVLLLGDEQLRLGRGLRSLWSGEGFVTLITVQLFNWFLEEWKSLTGDRNFSKKLWMLQVPRSANLYFGAPRYRLVLHLKYPCRIRGRFTRVSLGGVVLSHHLDRLVEHLPVAATSSTIGELNDRREAPYISLKVWDSCDQTWCDN